MSCSRRLFALPFLSIAALLLAVGSVEGDGPIGYSQVTQADLPLLSLNHYFDANGKSPGTKFVWTFAADGTFDVQPGEAGIPLDLRQRLAGDVAEAKQISGKWKLEGRMIRFSEVKIDGKPATPEEQASYSIYRTAPTVIRIGEPQYVFELLPAPPTR
jgi:hypothetical protein